METKMFKFLTLFFIVFTTISCTPLNHRDHSASEDSSEFKSDSSGLEDGIDPVADASAEYEDTEGLHFFGDFGHPRRPNAPNRNDADVKIDHSIELQGGSQTYFPSLVNIFNRPQLLGRSRPIEEFNQEGAYSQRPSALRNLINFQAPSYNGFRSSDYAKTIASSANNINGILGSGNFRVLRGGTFGETSDADVEAFDSSFYNNGHGRPTYFNPHNVYNHERFANFKDFADINAPGSAFSHFIPVYAHENGTAVRVLENETNENEHLAGKPKNIQETLDMIEKDSSMPQVEEINEQYYFIKIANGDSNDDDHHLPGRPKNIKETVELIEKENESVLPTLAEKSKLSKTKLKLAMSLLSDKTTKKKSKIVKKMLTKNDLVDPLLAVS